MVERTPIIADFYFCSARFFVFLVRDAASLLRDGGNMGSKVFNFRIILFDFPAFNVVFSWWEYVYAQNNDLRFFGVYGSGDSVVLEMK